MASLSILLNRDYGPQVTLKLHALTNLATEIASVMCSRSGSRSRLYSGSTLAASGEYSCNVYAAGAIVGSTFAKVVAGDDPADPTEAELLANEYEARVIAAGSTLTQDGYNAVVEVFQAAIDNEVTIADGWLFGSAVNVSKDLHLNLIHGRSSLVPQATLNAGSSLSSGILSLRVAGTNQGLVATTPLFTGDTDYGVLFLGGYTGDPAASQQTPPYILDQEYNTSSPGNVALLGASTGGHQWIDRPSYSTQIPNGLCEDNVGPVAMWWHFDSVGNQQLIHAGESTRKSTPAAFAGNPTGALRLAGKFNGNGDIGYCVLLRFNGVLDDAKRKDIFDRIWAAYRKLTKACLIIGNSVTISGVSHAYRTWPKQMQRWGLHNGVMVARRAEGTRRLPYFAPTGYALPPGSEADPSIAVKPVNDYDWFAPNVIINDDQQNMIAGGQPWASFLHCHNAIVGHFVPLNDDMRGVICTQIAHAPFTFSGYEPMTYSQVASARQRFLTATQAARIETQYNGVPTVHGEVYAPFNRGWPVSDDGTPEDPFDDLPNGDPALFATNDAQHPNQAGHDIMFGVYRDALIEVLAL